MSSDSPPSADTLLAMVAAGATVTAYRLKYGHPPEFRGIDSYEILERTAELAAPQADQISKLLAAPTTFGDREKVARCFAPGLAFRFARLHEKLEVAICLNCRWARFYTSAGMRDFPLSDAGLHSLIAAYIALFPGQPAPIPAEIADLPAGSEGAAAVMCIVLGGVGLMICLAIAGSTRDPRSIFIGLVLAVFCLFIVGLGFFLDSLRRAPK